MCFSLEGLYRTIYYKEETLEKKDFWDNKRI